MNVVVMILLTVAAAALFLTSLEVIATWIHLRRRRPFRDGLHQQAASCFSRAGASKVSILKPLCGIDDGLRENLEHFTRLDPERYEVIFSIADENDPAVDIVQQLLDEFPAASLRAVIGNRNWRIANPKVERLIAAMRVASGEVIFVSDSQVRAEAADINAAVVMLRDRSIGCVSNLFVGDGAQNVGALLESIHLLTFVVPGNAIASLAKVPCLVGKSMVLRREALERIGGFEAFADVLAEDQAIALALKKNGYRICLAPTTVRNFVARKTISAAMDRQVRWNKIRYSFSPAMYTSEILLNPLSCALLALFLSLAAGVLETAAAGTLGIIFLLRLVQTSALARLTGARPLFALAIFTPLQDLMQFAAYFVPFFSDQINWRGNRARLGRGTIILPLDQQPQQA